MPSTLARLFQYAKSSKSEALENFTTEALAAAIRDDPRPLIPVLVNAGLLSYDQDPTVLGVETQVAVPGAGIVDLDLVLEGEGWLTEVWVEVKVWAGESGQQLSSYQQVIATLPHQPLLVVLSKQPLGGHDDLPWISWQAIYEAALRGGRASPYWLDLGHFLEEIHMADAYDEPIIAGEAAALLAAHALYQKTARIIAATMESGKERWPVLGWPKSTNDADEQLLWQFKRLRRLTLPIRTTGPAQLFLGVAQHDASAEFDEPEPHLCVWVEHPAKQVDYRRVLLDQADAGALGETWARRVKGWWALTAHQRLGSFGSQAEAVSWLIDRLDELDRAAIIALLTTPGAMTVIGEDATSEGA